MSGYIPTVPSIGAILETIFEVTDFANRKEASGEEKLCILRAIKTDYATESTAVSQLIASHIESAIEFIESEIEVEIAEASEMLIKLHNEKKSSEKSEDSSPTTEE